MSGAHFLRPLTACLLLTTLAGCLYIPTNYYKEGSRHNVGEKAIAELQPGVTTKEEVFLKLGEPDFMDEEGGRLGYSWGKVRGLLIIVGTAGGAAALEFSKAHVVELSFDAQGRFTGSKQLSSWNTELGR